ncbi:MAG TPA: hypothetical protein PKE39_12815 [Ignavibacteria bacterium]|nr:hypothetical protein [Ignavibacteria bacterium]
MHKKLTYFIQSFIIILFAAVFLYSCGSDDTVTNTPPPEPVDTSDFQYPFTIGSYWNYTLTVSAENIRPDSILHYFSSYPLTGYGYTEILYDTVVQIGGPVRVIYDRLILGNDTTASRYYYSQNEYSMVCYGYRASTTASFPFRKLHNLPFGDLSGMNTLGIGYFSVSDTFLVITPPVIVLKYPVVKNTQWIMFDQGSSNISKKYISWENYHLDTAVIPCMQTQRIWSADGDKILYDYYSKYGQMKRNYLFKNQQYRNNLFITLGYYDEREEYKVTSFNIAAP